MKHPLPTTMAGESVELWPQRALFWPAGGTLFIADPHFGKAAAFRNFGIAASRSGPAKPISLSAAPNLRQLRPLSFDLPPNLSGAATLIR